MPAEFSAQVPGFNDVYIDANGDIEIGIDGGYYGEAVERTFTASDMQKIAAASAAHVQAYDQWWKEEFGEERKR